MLTQSFVSRDRASGFTLVEVLVSTALVVVIMALVLGTVDQTQRIFSRSSAKVAQFQSARRAFDAMTRRLGQSTLNTYYRAFDTDSKLEAAYFKYTRESELQFCPGRPQKSSAVRRCRACQSRCSRPTPRTRSSSRLHRLH
jgi:uncharacterized protein (TIGR02599 family)